MSRKSNTDEEPETIGKAHPGTERARDEEREDGGPRYGGGPWKVADERGDKRFGKARNDDADPSELEPGEQSEDDAVEDDGKTESAAQQAGFGRGEEPQKSK